MRDLNHMRLGNTLWSWVMAHAAAAAAEAIAPFVHDCPCSRRLVGLCCYGVRRPPLRAF